MWTRTRKFRSFLYAFCRILATGLTVWLVYLFGKELYASAKKGVGLATLYGLGTLAWPYSRYFFSEPLFCLCTFGSAYLLFKAKKAETAKIQNWNLVGSGFLLGFGLLVRVSGAFLLPAYVLYLWLTSSKHARLQERFKAFLIQSWWMALGALPTIVLLLLHNYLRFGNFFNNGYEGEGFTMPFWSGFSGLILSPGKSVFLYSPILFAVPIAAIYFARRYLAEFVFLGLVIAITVCYYSVWYAWWGGWCWGPRFLVPILPFAVLMIGTLLNSRWLTGIIFVILFPISVVVQMAGVAPDFAVFLRDEATGNPGEDYLRLINPVKSPFLEQWNMIWHADTNTIHSLTLNTIGLNHKSSFVISLIWVSLFIVSLFMVCYTYLHLSRQGRTSEKVVESEQQASLLLG